MILVTGDNSSNDMVAGEEQPSYSGKQVLFQHISVLHVLLSLVHLTTYCKWIRRDGEQKKNPTKNI